MRRIALLALLVLAGCTKFGNPLIGTEWTYGGSSDSQIVLAFIDATQVAVYEADSNMNVRYGRYYTGAYSVSGSSVTFDLTLKGFSMNTLYLDGEFNDYSMSVREQWVLESGVQIGQIQTNTYIKKK